MEEKKQWKTKAAYHFSKKNYIICKVEQSFNNTNEKLQYEVKELKLKNELLEDTNQNSNHIDIEYQKKIEELVKTNQDFDNLLENAEIGALFLDKELCLRKITPIMRRASNLKLQDEGRFLKDVQFMKEYPEYIEDAAEVLQDSSTIEKEVIASNGITWMIRTQPYYERDGNIDGVLTTIFDITKRLEAAKYELKLLTDSIPGGVIRLRYDGGLFIEYANAGMGIYGCYSNKEFQEMFQNYYNNIILPEDWKIVKREIEKAIKDEELIKVKYRIRAKNGDEQWRLFQAKILKNGKYPIIQGIVGNIDELIRVQQNLNSVINTIPGGILRISFNGEQIEPIFVSEQLYSLLGLSDDRGLKTTLFMKWNQKYGNTMKRSLVQAMKTGEVNIEEYCLETKTGETVWVQMRGSIVSRQEHGIIVQFVVIDVTAMKEAYYSLKKEQSKLNIVAGIVADLLFEYDIKTKTMHYTNQAEGVMLLPPIEGEYRWMIMHSGLVHTDDIDILEQFCDDLENGKDTIHYELRKKYTDGEFHWIEIMGKTILDTEGKPDRVIGKTSDINERKKKELWMKHQAERDSMTELYNRSTAVNLIQKEIRELKETECAVIFLIDIDDFKKINDEQGHTFGDAVLCSVVEEINEIFTGDIIKGRIGGDEFIVFAKNYSPRLIKEKSEIFLQKMHNIYVGESRSAAEDGTGAKVISASIGIVSCPKDGTSYEILIRKADSALYYSKEHGKDCYECYDEQIHHALIDEKFSYISGYENEKEKNIEVDAKYHNFIMIILELLDTAKDLKSAVNMVLDKICRYFSLDEILFLYEEEEGKTKVNFLRSRRDSNRKSEVDIYNKKYWESFQDYYDTDGIAEFTREDIQENDLKYFTSALAIKAYHDNNYMGIILFIDLKNKRSWKKEDKTVLHSITGILAGKLYRLKQDKKKDEEINFLLNYDSVTSLYNYTKFKQIAEQEIKQNPQNDYFFIVTDFYKFKYINKAYGYTGGDRILKEFGEFLRKQCEGGICYTRMTADNFVILVKDIDIERARSNYLHLSAAFCRKINREYKQTNLVVTSGICKVERSLNSVSLNIDNANTARKSIKYLAETECVIFTEELKSKMNSQMEMTINMTKALENKEFTVYLQPKVDLKTDEIAGAEALIRWKRPDGTIFYPDMFISLFEQNGFITKLDYYVLEQVLIWCQNILKKGKKVVPISVNFSRRHQEDAHFVDKILALLEMYHIDSKYIEVEITESVFMENLNKLKTNLEKLKEKGIDISIDDFGSGYSSLNVLASVSVDVIKLDKEFLKQMNGASSVEFLKYLIAMVKHLNFKVIAEGVETKEQVELLKESDCDMAQGYYYAKPMPIEEFERFMTEFKAK